MKYFCAPDAFAERHQGDYRTTSAVGRRAFTSADWQ
jgi:hypothetical protein